MRKQYASLRRRPLLAPVWLAALGGLVVIAIGFWLVSAASTTMVFVVRHAESGAPYLIAQHVAPHVHVIAPDLPGFGFSDAPSRSEFAYTFDHLAEVMGRFTDAIGLTHYAIYIFDYGAPVGLRMALRHPDRITAVVTQNGNAYEEGFAAIWNPIQRYWAFTPVQVRGSTPTAGTSNSMPPMLELPSR